MPVWGYRKFEVFIIPATPCTPDGIQHFLCARHDVGQTSTADDFWVVAFGVVFQWWYRPLGLLRFDVTQDHFQELLVLCVARCKIHVAFVAMLGDAVGLCFVRHIIPLRSGERDCPPRINIQPRRNSLINRTHEAI